MRCAKVLLLRSPGVAGTHAQAGRQAGRGSNWHTRDNISILKNEQHTILTVVYFEHQSGSNYKQREFHLGLDWRYTNSVLCGVSYFSSLLVALERLLELPLDARQLLRGKERLFSGARG